MLVQIESHRNLIRDTDSGAVLNTDREELEAYYAEVEMRKKQLEEKRTLENKVNKLEQDISDIKNLLQQLVTRT